MQCLCPCTVLYNPASTPRVWPRFCFLFLLFLPFFPFSSFPFLFFSFFPFSNIMSRTSRETYDYIICGYSSSLKEGNTVHSHYPQRWYGRMRDCRSSGRGSVSIHSRGRSGRLERLRSCFCYSSCVLILCVLNKWINFNLS